MRSTSIALANLAILAAAVLLAPGCSAGDRAQSSHSGDWSTVPTSPLSARERAVGIWTGDEVLIVGGSDARPCPPNASCELPEIPPLADGAAVNTRTGTWRTIRPAPVPFEWAESAFADSTAYLWIPGTPGRPRAARAFLAYHVDEDVWEQLPSQKLTSEYRIVQAGQHIAAYSDGDGKGPQPDLLFDTRTKAWQQLPADPFPTSAGRVIAWSGRELILFDYEPVPNPGSDTPFLPRLAALDLTTRTWRTVGHAGNLQAGPWAPLGDGRLVNPTLGGADGGETNNWGRTYPYGGVLDPVSGELSELPNPPDLGEFAAGVLTRAGGHYFGANGWVLDARAGNWIQIPHLPEVRHLSGRTVVAAGDDLFVFGGARWTSDSSGELTREARIWSPRP